MCRFDLDYGSEVMVYSPCGSIIGRCLVSVEYNQGVLPSAEAGVVDWQRQ